MTRHKADSSPVTEADEAAEELLTAAILAVDPGAIIVGEEAHAAGVRPDPCARFWLIDPLDGTKDFVAGRTGYSVNIGLIEAGVPVLGLVLSPRDGMLWAGSAGHGAWRETAAGARVRIATRRLPDAPVAVASHSHMDAATEAWLTAAALRFQSLDRQSAASSLKFCRLAEGSADLYPRHGPTMEWDTAAAHAVLLAAGGTIRATGGGPFAYAKPGYLNTGFLAVADPAAFARLPGF